MMLCLIPCRNKFHWNTANEHRVVVDTERVQAHGLGLRRSSGLHLCSIPALTFASVTFCCVPHFALTVVIQCGLPNYALLFGPFLDSTRNLIYSC